MDTLGSSTDSRTAPTVAPDSSADAGDDLGLSIDMLDVDRLREWARLILVHGPDISHWGSSTFVVSKMQTMATCIEKAIRDIGTLRNQRRVVEAVTAELTSALGSGALFNPEMFGSMLRDGDNPIRRWRDLLSPPPQDDRAAEKEVNP